MPSPRLRFHPSAPHASGTPSELGLSAPTDAGWPPRQCVKLPEELTRTGPLDFEALNGLLLWRVELVCALADVSVGYYRKLYRQGRTPPYADERHSHVTRADALAWLANRGKPQ